MRAVTCNAWLVMQTIAEGLPTRLMIASRPFLAWVLLVLLSRLAVVPLRAPDEPFPEPLRNRSRASSRLSKVSRYNGRLYAGR